MGNIIARGVKLFVYEVLLGILREYSRRKRLPREDDELGLGGGVCG